MAMALLTATWECISSITLVNCFRKAGISSESQAWSQSDDDPYKLLAAQLDELQDRGEFPIDFIVDGYVNEEVVISKAHRLKDSEIIAAWCRRIWWQEWERCSRLGNINTKEGSSP